MYEILDKVNIPQDIRGMETGQLRQLCADIRDYMVRCCAINPGHLASSLGTVEIITALHYIYDTPHDKLVFDVGHQTYAHKILTGRKAEFATNRTRNGISGFPRRDESEYDVFGAGHSSTSISAALGLAEAEKLKGGTSKIVALIGDGALSGGMAFEALNNGADSDILIILNDNQQSIDKNLGGLHNHLLNLTSGKAYNKFKDIIWKSLGETKARYFFQRWVRSLKSWFVKRTGGDIFESLGFRYFGPVDGNDIEEMVETLRKLKDLHGPRVLHCITVKGKGYAPAEADPTTWHAPGKFVPETGERLPSPHPFDRYQDVFGQTLIDLAKEDARVVGITPAMAGGCGMSRFASEMPERFYDVGIEEEHAVTFAAGLAAGGLKPFCNIYSSFAQRAYDQIIHDVALQHLPVVLCFDRAGLVGEDGATHHGAFDMAAFRCIPGTTIVAPSGELQLRNAMYTGLQQEAGPYIIRYPRGMGRGVEWKGVAWSTLPVGKGAALNEGSRIAILAAGPVAYKALEAAKAFAESGNPEPQVFDMIYVKPLDEDILERAAAIGRIVTVEDGSLKGGLWGAVCEYMAAHSHKPEIRGIGIPDEFIVQGKQSEELEECGISVRGILEALESLK